MNLRSVRLEFENLSQRRKTFSDVSLHGKLLSHDSFAIFPASCSVLIKELFLLLFVSLSFFLEAFNYLMSLGKGLYVFKKETQKPNNNNKNKNMQEADWTASFWEPVPEWSGLCATAIDLFNGKGPLLLPS